MGKKRELKDFFGILPEGMGERMQKRLQEDKEWELKNQKKRMDMLYGKH